MAGGITPVAPRARKDDFRLEGGSHPMRVPLSPNVQAVRPGTPLLPTPLGWEVARDFAKARAIAVTFGTGGTTVHARKSATFDVGKPLFGIGDQLDIADIDDTGYVTFKRSEDGRMFAESKSTVHMSVE